MVLMKSICFANGNHWCSLKLLVLPEEINDYSEKYMFCLRKPMMFLQSKSFLFTKTMSFLKRICFAKGESMVFMKSIFVAWGDPWFSWTVQVLLNNTNVFPRKKLKTLEGTHKNKNFQDFQDLGEGGACESARSFGFVFVLCLFKRFQWFSQKHMSC